MSEDKYEVFNGISRDRLEDILKGIEKVRVALIGDMCIDIYWRADMTLSSLSRETPHFPLPVVEERLSPGAGANAVANIAGLNPAKTYALGITGDDWRGKLLLHELENRNIDVSGVFISSSLKTNAYCKPLRSGISDLVYEDPRIDFANYELLPPEDEKKLIDKLEQIVKEIDVLCVSDQFEFGCITQNVRQKIINLARNGLPVVVDSRDRIDLYTDVTLKPNEFEGLKAAHKSTMAKNAGLEELVSAAGVLARANNAKVCMTLGSRGSLYKDSKNTTIYIPSYNVNPPIDTCGAGDTFLSAYACAIAADALPQEAAYFGNIAADVIVKKVGITGTASPDEISARHKEILNVQL